MYEFKKSPISQHIRFRFFITLGSSIFLFVIAVLAARATWSMYEKFSEASQAADEAQQELAQLTLQEARVNASLNNLSSERGIEAQVRERFGVARPGESKIQIVRDSNASTTLRATSEGNVFMRIFRALFVW